MPNARPTPGLRRTPERREQINRRLARLQHLYDERLPIPYDSARRLMRDVTELLHDLDVLEQALAQTELARLYDLGEHLRAQERAEQAERERDEARREVEQLREALEAILGEIADEAAGHETEWPAWVRRVWQIAVRAASGQERGEGV